MCDWLKLWRRNNSKFEENMEYLIQYLTKRKSSLLADNLSEGAPPPLMIMRQLCARFMKLLFTQFCLHVKICQN